MKEKGMKRISLMLLSSFTCGVLSAQSIIERVDAFRMPWDAFLIRTHITSYKDDKVKESAVYDAYINGNEKSLVIEKEGKNRDMKILYNEEKLYVQLVGSRRPIRITPMQRLMGQASNGDVARVSFGEDYDVERAGDTSVGQVKCLKLLLSAKKKSATYHRITLYIRKSDFRPVKAEFYLVSGKHFKTAYYEKYMPLAGSTTLQRMTIFDELRKNQKTVMEYSHMKQKTIDAKYFNKNYLIHVRGL